MALALARRGLGRVWPNPAVGCVLVRDGVVIGRGWTQPGGRTHAETQALARAGPAAAGATAYVSLEPCAHHARTPPCADALIAAGIARAVIATIDPDPRTGGKGVEQLRAHRIEVTTGIAEKEAARLNAGFFLRIAEGRPLFTLKAATSLDGRIATRSGHSRWITGEAARRRGHWLRASHDAILVGSGTALADDPELTCRLPGLADRSPVRIVADGRLRLDRDSKLVKTARIAPLWVLTVPGSAENRREALVHAGVELIEVTADASGHPEAGAMALALGTRGLTRVLIEGGGSLAASFLAAGLIDDVTWFHAPLIIGGDGRAAAAPLGVETVPAAPAFVREKLAPVGADVMESYGRGA